MPQLRIFLSHSHSDDAYCREFVEHLRGPDLDLWYDEHNLGSGELVDVVSKEIRNRSIFLVILSPAAFNSPWVRNEVNWAFNLMRRNPERVLLPITGAHFTADLFDDWLYIEDFKRIEDVDIQPFPPAESARRVLLALTHIFTMFELS